MAKEKSSKENEDEFDETSIYDEEGRKDLVEDDEMSAEEEGFMQGYEEAEEKEDEVDAVKDEEE